MNKKQLALAIRGLEVNYGAIKALKGVDIKVYEGDVVAILGANGAGKTTTLKKISGLIEDSKGSIKLYGKEIINMEANQISGLGIAQSPEGRAIFHDLTVEENLKIGAFLISDKEKIEKNFERVYGYFPVLSERKTDRKSVV